MSQIYHRICPQCGTSLLANQHFCSNCGATAEVVPGVLQNSTRDGQAFPPVPASLSIPNIQPPQPPQFQVNQHVPSAPGTPSLPQQPHPYSQLGQAAQPAPFHAAPVQSPSSLPQQAQHPAYPAQPAPFHAAPVQGQHSLPQQAHLPSAHGLHQVQAP